MKNIFFSIMLIGAAAGIYFYNNPKADFNTDKADGIQFRRGNWEDALALAKKDDKLIFLDIYATWCGPCKKLKKYSFADKRVGNYFNAHFINVALDGEQAEGDLLARKYGVTGYPTLLFIDASGKAVAKRSGYLSANELLGYGRSIPQ